MGLAQRQGRRVFLTLFAAALAIGCASAPAAGAKKAKDLDVTKEVNQATPLATNSGLDDGVLLSTIEAGKRFKGLRVRDVEVTVQTTGSEAFALNNLRLLLMSPEGTSQDLMTGLSGQSMGPVTFDDESRFTFGIFGGPAPCGGPYYLCEPYVGRVRSGGDAEAPLFVFDGGRVRGTWSLYAINSSTTRVSTLNFWRLDVNARRPYLTKDR